VSIVSLYDIKGKAAIVTGGNGGFGVGIARGLAEAGANIIVAGRNVEKTVAAARELESLGRQPLSK
jgi:2-dehydro-3-deoxy-D-gluconate 5-dehydrogenase